MAQNAAHRAAGVAVELSAEALSQGELTAQRRGSFDRHHLQSRSHHVFASSRLGARAITVGDSLDRTGPYTGLKISFEHIPALRTFRWLGVDVPAIGPP